eukprot:TRINITY_DN1282_c0_g1_i2.p1 TRINITY_DN1282_c0_g1~~TRINITY_DN1282_c0_g1_i2.p1  ORF type:complete len:212 (+),score=65.13 TRINITY_DN1282_c0_g1_i2:37-636(+)
MNNKHQKVVMVGEMSVGKTSIVNRFIKNEFNTNVRATVGSSCAYRVMKVDDEDVSFCLWDTAGQEAYHSLVDLYFRDAAAVVLVFDVSMPESLEKAKTWITKVHQHAPRGVVVALVGNKIDCEKKILTSDATDSAEDIGAFYAAVSARTGEGIEKLFEDLARKIRAKIKAQAAAATAEKPTPTVPLTTSSGGSSGRCKC